MAFWFRRKFARKLAFSFSLTTFFAVALTGLLLGRSFRQSMINELGHNLATQAALIDTQIDKTLFVKKNQSALQNLAHHLDKITRCRVTFISAAGVVMGDSSLRTEELSGVENHSGRPEIIQALSGGEGHAVRFSATVHENFLYAAVPVRSTDGALIGFVRLAFPLTQIEKREQAVYIHIAILSLAALFIAILISLFISRSLSRPVTEMSMVAEQLAEGRYEKRVNLLSNDEHGQLGHTFNTLAERVQTTVEELSHDKAHLSTILSNMDEAVVAVDTANRVTAVNPALSRIFGLPRKEANGKLFLEALRQNQLNALLQNVLSDQQTRTDEVRTFAPDERIFEAHAVPLMQDGRCTGALLVLHDITRIRRLEQVRRDFVANVSHELRTPLAAVKGFAETLRSGALGDPKHSLEFVESIEKHTDNMTALVEDLLDLTAIESGQNVPIREPVSLSDTLVEVIRGIKPVAERKKIKIELRTDDNLPKISVDAGHLKQIFTNLLDNAVKFNSDNGTATVTAKIHDGAVHVNVADSGIGIPAQDIPRIFERFYRVDKARSRAMGGTGLGLSIVKHLVEANGGSVIVESTVGKGSTFSVRFPLS